MSMLTWAGIWLHVKRGSIPLGMKSTFITGQQMLLTGRESIANKEQINVMAGGPCYIDMIIYICSLDVEIIYTIYSISIDRKKWKNRSVD